jgi:hypothetical protein
MLAETQQQVIQCGKKGSRAARLCGSGVEVIGCELYRTKGRLQGGNRRPDIPGGHGKAKL